MRKERLGMKNSNSRKIRAGKIRTAALLCSGIMMAAGGCVYPKRPSVAPLERNKVTVVNVDEGPADLLKPYPGKEEKRMTKLTKKKTDPSTMLKDYPETEEETKSKKHVFKGKSDKLRTLKPLPPREEGEGDKLHTLKPLPPPLKEGEGDKLRTLKPLPSHEEGEEKGNMIKEAYYDVKRFIMKIWKLMKNDFSD